MAYALLANLPPVTGLYVSFFSVLVYFFLGTSRHLSLGTFAVITLMTGKVVDSYMSRHPYLGHASGNNSSFSHMNGSDFSLLNDSITTTMSPPSDDDFMAVKVKVAAAIAFFVGLLQVGMGVLQLGTLSVYLSDTLVSGFTTGAACHVFTSQVKYVLGIKIPNYGGIGALYYSYADIYRHLYLTNYVTVAISLSSLVSLVLVNDYINAKYKEKMVMPIPMELIVIVSTTLASYYLKLNTVYKVQIVKNIPIGIPPPTLPPLEVIPDIVTDCIALAVVSYCIPISLAKIFAKRKNYDIDTNQELFAYGVGNFIGSFFSCFPSCGSLSRSSVQESSGSKTQVASLVSCVLVLIVLLFIAPLFEPVPNCVLSCIIFVALRSIFRQVTDLKGAWEVSKREAAIWIVSFGSVVVLDVDLGLLVSVCFLILMVVYRLQRPSATELGNVPGTNFYLDLDKYKVTKRITGIKIIHFGGALYFANREYFKQECNKLVFRPQKESSIKKNLEQKKSLENGNLKPTIPWDNMMEDFRNRNISTFSQTRLPYETDCGNDSLSPEVLSALIIDCSVMSFVDMGGIATLSQIYTDYGAKKIGVYLSGCNDNVLMKIERTTLFVQIKANIFPTIHDAVMHIITKQMDCSQPSSDPNLHTHL